MKYPVIVTKEDPDLWKAGRMSWKIRGAVRNYLEMVPMDETDDLCFYTSAE